MNRIDHLCRKPDRIGDLVRVSAMPAPASAPRLQNMSTPAMEGPGRTYTSFEARVLKTCSPTTENVEHCLIYHKLTAALPICPRSFPQKG